MRAHQKQIGFGDGFLQLLRLVGVAYPAFQEAERSRGLGLYRFGFSNEEIADEFGFSLEAHLRLVARDLRDLRRDVEGNGILRRSALPFGGGDVSQRQIRAEDVHHAWRYVY